MKIAFFHELTPLSGARKVAEEYGKILGKEHEIDLYYVDDREDAGVSSIFNKVYFFKFTVSKSRVYRDSIGLIRLYFLHKKIAKIMQSKDYDFVFVSPSKFTQSPFLLRMVKKTIYFCQEPLRMVYDPLFRLPENLNFFKKMYERTNRFTRKIIDKNNINKARIIVSNSLFSKENIKTAYRINSKLCYLGVDTNKFKPVRINKTTDILFIGEKENIEGFDFLENTMALYKNKPVLKFVTRDAKGIGINEQNLIAEINKAKIVLALSRNEPFGLIPIESMACEVPVIAVNEGGFNESVINNKTGFLIKRDPKELKEKIDLLLLDDKLRVQMGKSGRKLVLDKFTWVISVNNFLNIAKAII
jgi:glycosyltransferase involved in cell wall biosynthesis